MYRVLGHSKDLHATRRSREYVIDPMLYGGSPNRRNSPHYGDDPSLERSTENAFDASALCFSKCSLALEARQLYFSPDQWASWGEKHLRFFWRFAKDWKYFSIRKM